MSEVKGAAMELGTERIRKFARSICRAGHYRDDRLVAVQHGGQHLYRARRGGAAISGAGLTFPADEPRGGVQFVGGCGRRDAGVDALGQRDYETAQRILGGMSWCSA